MSIQIIQEKLKQYSCQSWQEEEFALREIYQEIALAAFSRTNFFKLASFQGGTALRIFYSMERFSEDLDFMLKQPDKLFNLWSYTNQLMDEFKIYGLPITVQDRSKAGNAVQKLFLKQESEGLLLELRSQPRDRQPKKIQIKIEVDTNPPSESHFETKYLDFPFPFGVTLQDLPSLFAGKNHALLCREYTKGRDWYDFQWYVARRTPINFDFLSKTCHQTGPWQGKNIKIDKEWYFAEMEKKIREINWQEAKNDVARFIRMHEQESLQLWSQEFFLDRLEKMRQYL